MTPWPIRGASSHHNQSKRGGPDAEDFACEVLHGATALPNSLAPAQYHLISQSLSVTRGRPTPSGDEECRARLLGQSLVGVFGYSPPHSIGERLVEDVSI